MGVYCKVAKLTEQGFEEYRDRDFLLTTICILETLYKKYIGKDELPFITIHIDEFLYYDKDDYDEYESEKFLKYYSSQQLKINNHDSFDEEFINKLSKDQIMKDVENDKYFAEDIDKLVNAINSDTLKPDLNHYIKIYQELKGLFEQGYIYLCIMS